MHRFAKHVGENLAPTMLRSDPQEDLRPSFARSISLDGNQLAIGCMNAFNGTGAAIIYQKQNEKFIFEVALTPVTNERRANFGSDISILGDRLAIAGWRSDQVALFERQAEHWQQTVILYGGDHFADECGFGDSIDLHPNELLISDGSTKTLGGQIFTYHYQD